MDDSHSSCGDYRAVHVLRSEHGLGTSRASRAVVLAGLAGIAAATALPFSPAAETLGFAALPAEFWSLLALVSAGYVATLALVKPRN